jgi:hypothetical protein
MPPNARRAAARLRERSKRIISAEEAGELRADPTYVNIDAVEHNAHNVLFDDCSFPANSSVPIYRVHSSLSTEYSLFEQLPHVLSFQFQHESLGRNVTKSVNNACAEQGDVGVGYSAPACGSVMQVGAVVKDPEVSNSHRNMHSPPQLLYNRSWRESANEDERMLISLLLHATCSFIAARFPGRETSPTVGD